MAINYFDLESNPADMNNPANKHLDNVKTYFSILGSIPAVTEVVSSILYNVIGYKKTIFGKDCLILKEKKIFAL